MKTVPLHILRGVVQGRPDPIDLVQVFAFRAVTPDLFFAFHDRPVTYLGDKYIAVGVSQFQMTEKPNQKAEGISFNFPNTDRELGLLVHSVDMGGVKFKIIRVSRSRLDKDESTLVFEGRISSTEVTAAQVIFSVDPMIINDAIVPRRELANRCPYKFGGEGCFVDTTVSTIRFDFAAVAGSTDEIIQLGSGAVTASGMDATKLPALLVAEDGDNVGAVRAVKIIDSTFDQIVVTKPFHLLPCAGDLFSFRRQCGKTLDFCDEFVNLPLYGGFAYQPKDPRNLKRTIG